MEKEIDYKHEVIDCVDKEFKAYEADLLDGKKTPEEVYCHSYETSVKTEFRDTICGEVEFDDNVYKALYQKRGEILADMHTAFIGDLEANLLNRNGVKRFIESYCESEYPEIMHEHDETPQMGMG